MITQKIYATDIEDRIDPHFYKHKYLEVATRLKRLKTPTKRVDSFSNVICGPFGSAIKVNDYTENGVPLIRIENIDKTDGVSSTNVTFINEKLASSLKSYKVNTGDLVISQRGTLGLSGVIRDDLDGAVISANLIAIKNLREVNPDYLQFFFSSNLGQIQLERRTSGQVQTKITTEDIKALLVPIPSKEIQQKIINLFLDAIKDRKEKLKQADELLNSIDSYVRQRLGIDYTELEEEKIYTVNSQDLEDNRQDPYYHKPAYYRILKTIKKGTYKVVELREVLKKVSRPFKPLPNENYDYIQLGFIEIETGFIKEYRKISLPDIPARATQVVKRNEILFSLSAPQMGNHFIAIPRKDEAAVSSGFIILSPNNNNSHFYTQLLKNSIYKKLYEKYLTGAGLFQTILISDLLSLPIPHPPINIQNTIGNEVKSRIEKATRLKAEAKKITKDAKKKVETMILN